MLRSWGGPGEHWTPQPPGSAPLPFGEPQRKERSVWGKSRPSDFPRTQTVRWLRGDHCHQVSAGLLTCRRSEARLARKKTSLADHGARTSPRGGRALPGRCPPPRTRSRVLTWSAQVGLGRGRRLARRRGAGASPLPTSQAGAHLGDLRGSGAWVRPLLETQEAQREGRRRRRRRSRTERQL